MKNILKLTFFAVFFCLSTSVIAAEPDRTYCELAGYFIGEGDSFLASVARQGVINQALEGSQCSLIWQSAEQIGKRSAAGKSLESDIETERKAASFRSKVLNFILKGVSN